MKKANIIIVGFGIIGKLEYEVLNKNKDFNLDFLDKTNCSSIRGSLYHYQDAIAAAKNFKYDLALVAVPSPLINGKCDTTEVWDAVESVDAKVYLIKSTIPVGTCDEIAAATGKHIVHSPEHSGATQHCTNFDYDFTILGGDKKDCQFVQQIYQEVYDARHVFKFVDRKTAELSKYMLNSYLAMKVSFCNSFWDICQKEGLSYEELRECFILDPRINAAHTFVYDEHPYWDSHCFNKDIPAIANQYDVELLKAVVDYNSKRKKQNN